MRIRLDGTKAISSSISARVLRTARRGAGILLLCLAATCSCGVAAALDTATPVQPYLAFNPVAVGVSSSAAQQLTASFSVTGTDTPTATIHYGHDYTAGAVTCTPNGGGQTCTVPVTFSPTLPGTRKDALFLKDGSTILATVYLGGVGQSPLALVQPGVVTQLVSGAAYSQSQSAVDENGTVYVLSPNSPYGSNIYSVTKAGVVSVVPVNVSAPAGIAIDGAGILYIPSAAPGSNVITWNTVTQTQGLISAAQPPPYSCSAQSPDPEQLSGAAVDAMGNVFTLDEVCQSVIEVKPDGTSAVTAINPAMNADPTWIAVDSSGNLFFACVDIINELLANGNQSAITNPGDPESNDLSVDAAESLYILPHVGGGIAELPASNYQSPQASLDPTTTILGLGLGSDGTLYAGTFSTLDKVDRSQGAIAFGQQVIGTASAAQNVGLYNGGNESLTISGIAVTGASSGFATQPAAVNNCAEGLQLTPGEYCQVAAILNPTQAGELTESIVFTTNSLNNPNSMETVALSGFVPGPNASLAPNPVAFGNQLATTTSAAATVTLSNTGTAALTGIVISLAGTDRSGFAITTGTNACGSSLAASSTCSIYVTFMPTAAASYAATLSVADNATGSPQTVALTGTGISNTAVLTITETIHTTDTPSARESLTMNVLETIHTADAFAVSGGGSLTMNIAETIQIADAPALTATPTPGPFATSTVLSSSANPSSSGQSVTFTAIVSSTSGSTGTPAGTVQFSVNGTAAGAPVPLDSSGQAQYSTSTLPDSSSSITAAFSGSGSFLSSTSAALSQTVLDFEFTPSGAGSSASVSPGGRVSFQFAVAPQGTFGSTITFSASGLPPGATASFDPPSLMPGSTANAVVMTIQTAQASAAARPDWERAAKSPLLLGLLLPLFGIGRARRAFRCRTYFLTALLSLGIAFAVSACGGSGFLTPSPQTYTITVTATSGALQHSTTVKLTVQ